VVHCTAAVLHITHAPPATQHYKWYKLQQPHITHAPPATQHYKWYKLQHSPALKV
jgi:hypothetical protein